MTAQVDFPLFDSFDKLHDESFRNSVLKPQLTTVEKVIKFIATLGIMVGAGFLGAFLTGVFAPAGPIAAPVMGSGLAFAAAITAIGKLEAYFNERAAARILQNLAIIPTA